MLPTAWGWRRWGWLGRVGPLSQTGCSSERGDRAALNARPRTVPLEAVAVVMQVSSAWPRGVPHLSLSPLAGSPGPLWEPEDQIAGEEPGCVCMCPAPP